jgi:hypothetical protein
VYDNQSQFEEIQTETQGRHVMMEILLMGTDEAPHVTLKQDGPELEDHSQLQILALKFEEMERGSIPYQHIEMMGTQFQEMGEAAAVPKRLGGPDLEELLQFLILALRTEEITKRSEAKHEMMEIL